MNCYGCRKEVSRFEILEEQGFYVSGGRPALDLNEVDIKFKIKVRCFDCRKIFYWEPSTNEIEGRDDMSILRKVF